MFRRHVQFAQPLHPLFLGTRNGYRFLLQVYINPNNLIIHCTLHLLTTSLTTISDEIRKILREELRQLTTDYISHPVFRSDFSLQFIYPSLRLSLLHQGQILSHLFHKTELAEALQNNPVLCPCIPAAYFSWESIQIHTYQATAVFVLHPLFSTHVFEWFKRNQYQLYRYEETKNQLSVYMTRYQDKARQLVAKYTICDGKHTVYLLFLPFMSSLVTPPTTPLLQLLDRSQSRRTTLRGSRWENSTEEESISVVQYYERLQSELQLGYSLFYTFSEMFNSVLVMRGHRHPSLREEENDEHDENDENDEGKKEKMMMMMGVEKSDDDEQIRKRRDSILSQLITSQTDVHHEL